MDTVKAHRKRVRRYSRPEVNRHKYSIFVVVVFVPSRTVAIGIKPVTYRRHCSGKLTFAYADRNAVHDPPHKAFPHVSIHLLQNERREIFNYIRSILPCH
jgi:hypothetical protein